MAEKRSVALDVESLQETSRDSEEKSLIPKPQETDDTESSLPDDPSLEKEQSALSTSSVSSTGLKVLIFLALHNCSHNLLLRYVMKDQPNFLKSAAVTGVELTKLGLSVLYVLLVDKRSLASIWTFLRDDVRNSVLLTVPATSYSIQMSLQYVALANMDAAIFSVLMQLKLLTTACFAVVFLQKKLRYVQVLSLLLLTVGVMLCNMKKVGAVQDVVVETHNARGILATLGIATSSGFASVYTEKVIKTKRITSVEQKNYSLAYMQIQLALVALVVVGSYALIMDYEVIREHGLWHNFTAGAFVSVFNAGIGGLSVAAALKYADSVLKGYATAISVIITGALSMILFGTRLHANYFLGIVNVVCAVLLYNGKDLDKLLC